MKLASLAIVVLLIMPPTIVGTAAYVGMQYKRHHRIGRVKTKCLKFMPTLDLQQSTVGRLLVPILRYAA